MHKPDFSKPEVLLCIYRSLFITAFLFLAFFLSHLVDNRIWATSLAATSFIVFAFPKADSVRTRVVIGGYTSACIFGVLASFLVPLFSYEYWTTLILCSLAVFLTTLAMTLFDFEHPPAAALAISLVLSEHAFRLALVSMFSVILLCFLKKPVAILLLKNSHKKPK